jgi:DNA end-binding protein Ku
MVKLATQLIERQEAKFEPADTADRYEARLREVIDAKLKGEGITPEEPESERGDNVIDLMAALKRSLGDEKKGAKKPAARKTAAEKEAPAKARKRA